MTAHSDLSPETLRQAFDKAAPLYDSEFDELEGTKRLRGLTMNTFFRYFSPGDYLLELNCGTGTDAISLAQRGCRVLATDVSSSMLCEVQRKIERENLHGAVSTQLLSFERMSTLEGEIFDGAYSNMGGLNCTPDLRPIAANLARLLRGGSYFVACLMSDFSFWETVSFLARGELAQAFRRRRPGGALSNVQGETVQAYYYSPSEVVSAFTPYFKRIEMVGLNILTPPPQSRRAYRALGRLNVILEKFDDSISRFYPFYRLGDHFVIVFERTDV